MGHLKDLDFADNLALISETIKHLQDETNRLFKYAGQVNVQKTKVTIIPTNPNHYITINDEQLKQTQQIHIFGEHY